ncbi:MAG: Gfo/Idh/MocA family oxidoreductase [Anaerolineae bacterium]
MLKIGLIGSGFMGAIHADRWTRLRDLGFPVELMGCRSVDPATATNLAERYGIALYDDLNTLIAASDVVDVCSPTYLHAEHASLAARAGKHVVSEKPLARTAEDAAALVELCEQAGVTLLVGHVVRFFPEYAAAKGIVERGEIGDVAVVRLTRCSFKPQADNPESWFHNSAYSGGMMLDLMIHDFDYARWVGGEVTRVFARHVGARAGDDGDYALVTLRHASGAISHVEGGWAYPKPMFRTALEIAGSDGLIEHPAGRTSPVNIYLHQKAGGGAVDIAVPRNLLTPEDDPYMLEIRHFYDVLTGAATPRVTARDGLAAVRIALAAIQSAESGRPVSLEGGAS